MNNTNNNNNMYIYNFCNVINGNMYDESIPKTKKEDYIKKYNLINIGNIKEYWINNVCCTCNSIGEWNYKYYKDISVEYKENILKQEIEISNCKLFNFYKTDNEYEYNLYENIINGITHQIREFPNYITYLYKSENNII